MVRPGDLAQGAPDPGDALRRAERLFDSASQSGLDLSQLDETATHIARLACQRAPYLATLLTRDPGRLGRVARDPYLRREKPRSQLIAEVDLAIAKVIAGGFGMGKAVSRKSLELSGAWRPSELGANAGDDATSTATAEAVKSTLRRVRADELVRLGVRELELGLDTEVGRELSRLADVSYDAAIRFHDAQLRGKYGTPRFVDHDGRERTARLAVIGMGKLGGEELNFASDVDVIYVYSSDQGEVGRLSLHEYFAKLCSLVTAALSEVTEDDVVFRVDLRLRPEGAKGAIASSLESLERYYETFGRPWERQAWIKARACAGDRALGTEAIEMLQPFVFPRLTSPTVVDDVRDLNRRIKRELVRPGERGFDVKNGEGGIREIEFFVQALQLIHAGKRTSLRCRGTLQALDALLFAGLVADDEHLKLYRAYRWLRHAEHVLQLEAGLQTQTLPAEPELRDVFAKRLGLSGAPELEARLERHTSEVAALFATLGDEPETDRPDVTAILRGELSTEAEAAALERLGFVDITAAQAELVRARRRANTPLSPGASERLARVGAMLLDEMAGSADPDQALRALGDLIARRGETWSIWRLLDEQPRLSRLLGSLFGASTYLARTLVDTPELIDLLVELGQSPPTRTAEQVGTDLRARLATVDASDPEAVWSTIAEVKNGHVLRVGIADFAGALDPLAVGVELTAIAEACLQSALAYVESQMLRPHSGALSVLGLGKLGGHELGYAADLDVVFVYQGDDDAVEHFSRLAQRLLNGLRQRTVRGRLYEVDTRLRPSGSHGLLVSSLAAWRRYHEQDARLWERQALIKLRPVAGDAALGAEVERLAAETVYGTRHDAKHVADEITTMRDRIERELGGKHDLKVNAGGVIDIEFAAQYLQLVHGHAHPELRTTSTAHALRAAAALGIAPRHEVELLEEGYRFLRGIEHRLRVVHDQPIHRLPEAREELDRLARRSGFPDGATLLERVERWQHEIRAAYRVLLGA